MLTSCVFSFAIEDVKICFARKNIKLCNLCTLICVKSNICVDDVTAYIQFALCLLYYAMCYFSDCAVSRYFFDCTVSFVILFIVLYHVLFHSLYCVSCVILLILLCQVLFYSSYCVRCSFVHRTVSCVISFIVLCQV